MPDTSAGIIDDARKAGMVRTLAMVSAGKDSVALTAILNRHEVDTFYVSKFLVPDLEVEEEGRFTTAATPELRTDGNSAPCSATTSSTAFRFCHVS